MNVEELQSTWTEMSRELEKQKKLTHQIIMQMTQIRYQNHLQKIANYEGFGAVICIVIAFAILFNFERLDTWYLQLSGLITIIFLLVLPVMVLRSIRSMKRINISQGRYADNLVAFNKARNQFLFIQRMGIGLGFGLIITIMPVAGKILNNRDLFLESRVWLWYVPLMVVFLIFFSRWGYGAYKRITSSAETILNETEERQ